MNIWVNNDGTRNRDFRPYIQEEETGKSTYIYDPNRPIHYGLYDRDQTTVSSYPMWRDIFDQYPNRANPIQTISRYNTQPNISHGRKFKMVSNFN